jgi:hypothetical protein
VFMTLLRVLLLRFWGLEKRERRPPRVLVEH